MINLGAHKEQVMKEKVNLNKSLTPRSEVCTIHGLTFKHNDYNGQDGYDVSLVLEGKDLTSHGFEGFLIDQNNPELGRYKGPIGTVKLSQFTFVTKVWAGKNGKPDNEVDRDTAIVLELGKIAKIVNKVDELFSGDSPNIEAVIEKASRVFAGTKINVTIGGKEYEKNGYSRYELFLVKPDKNFFNMEEPGKTPSYLQKFDPVKHLIPKKAGSGSTVAGDAPVANFEMTEVEFEVNV